MDVLVEVGCLLPAEDALEAVENFIAMVQEGVRESCRVDSDYYPKGGGAIRDDCVGRKRWKELTEYAINQDIPSSEAEITRVSNKINTAGGRENILGRRIVIVQCLVEECVVPHSVRHGV